MNTLPIVRLDNGRTTYSSNEFSCLLFVSDNLCMLAGWKPIQIHLQDAVGINHHDGFFFGEQAYYALVDDPPGNGIEGKCVSERNNYSASVLVLPGAWILGIWLAEFTHDRARETL